MPAPRAARVPGGSGGTMEERARELRAAIHAVRSACRVCQAVQERMVGAALEKRDKSPVTVADFASQAIVCRSVALELPGDPIVAEEVSDELRREDNAKVREA